MKNRINLITILMFLILIVILLVYYISNDSKLPTKKDNNYTLSSGDEILIGKEYEEGYYDITYNNNNNEKTGEIMGYEFEDGDTIYNKVIYDENKISYTLNGGEFKLQSSTFEENMDEISGAGDYYFSKNFPRSKYNVCNNGDESVQVDGTDIQVDECKVINFEDHKGIDYISIATIDETQGKVVTEARSINVSFEEV